ncbi:MAG: hypothetical protein HN742_35015 [Lentisphaerae bacterium]|jgi:YbbR domain-containing protein|nr:hypothetical protein [Lentisphaerota bacterium]MBT4822381.1 hypothetical protein [Lentisphaerota bacterium]MBT5609219.1 hypothetical protein [Lentisphaerota bacterium]MBT7059902.1 hypothetical protein [Lentisphaerota bacterium]MBT7847135.1 hypothetical protein [Lentisphaerota bacterium]
MKRWFHRLFRVDLARKLVAAFFAVLIWFAVRTQLRNFTTLYNIPVKLHYDPSALVLEDTVLTVDVTLRGVEKRLQRVKTTDVEVNVTVPSNLAAGMFFCQLRITPDDVYAPFGTHVVDVAPARQQIQYDRIIAKRNVPIRVRFDGRLREGYRNTHSVLPSRVDVLGPSRILKDVHELVTEPVKLDNTITQDFEMDVKLLPLPKVLTNTEVHVAVEIEKHSSEQAFRDLPMSVLTAPNCDLCVKDLPPHVSVTLHGPKLALEAIDQQSVHPFIDVTAITSPGTYRRPVQVWVSGAAGVVAEDMQPSVAEVVLVTRKEAVSAPRKKPVPAPSPSSPGTSPQKKAATP